MRLFTAEECKKEKASEFRKETFEKALKKSKHG
jgi:hypothetical protein